MGTGIRTRIAHLEFLRYAWMGAICKLLSPLLVSLKELKIDNETTHIMPNLPLDTSSDSTVSPLPSGSGCTALAYMPLPLSLASGSGGAPAQDSNTNAEDAHSGSPKPSDLYACVKKNYTCIVALLI
ncbi:hypothetical protein QE152_g12590 [Popillia japonica]|uniref:Uncharacterized protein n=1 Tax=Popillia japonica TaxID=7064 RepID=A0AAW1LIE7_POPJA